MSESYFASPLSFSASGNAGPTVFRRLDRDSDGALSISELSQSAEASTFGGISRPSALLSSRSLLSGGAIVAASSAPVAAVSAHTRQSASAAYKFAAHTAN